MNLAGLDLVRRGLTFAPRNGQQRRDPESAPSESQPEMQERGTHRARLFPLSRPTLPTMFRRRSNSHSTPQQPVNQEGIESPKTPRFRLGLGTLPSTRLHLPHLTRTWTSGSNGPDSRPPTGRPATADGLEPGLASSNTTPAISPGLREPSPAAQPQGSRGRRWTPRRFEGVDPAELHLAQMAEDGRRRRNRRRIRSERDEQGPPKRFLYCFPWIQSRRIRSQILRCFVSGLFLTLLLAVYLALSITNNVDKKEFSVLLILIILFATIFFCHGLIRLCIMVVRPNRDVGRRGQLQQFVAPGGYAVPRQPIRVILARDEEIAGVEQDANVHKPPAYGLWRESVRVDPNRLFWQRNDEAREGEASSSSRPSESRSSARPPSYASDDGVQYVVEAAPRSIAPTTDVPLPPHPSEAGRWDGRQAPW